VHYFDLHVAENFKWGRAQSAELAIDIFNVFDLSEAVTNYENDDANFGLVLYRQAPRSIRASLTVSY
jgi:hypothetical protein